MEPKIYDLIIVGGACAGLAAATYASRRAMSVLVITKDTGGQIATTPSVENYPGIDFINGADLANAMQAQAVKWGTELVYDEVIKLEKRAEKDFLVTTHPTQYQGRSLLLAYGKTPRNLEVPGEKEYAGRGVSYCVTCDAPLFKGKTVTVVGGGNSAMEGALILADICEKVYLVHRREEFRGEAVILDQINSKPNIEKVLSSVSSEVMGNGQVVTGLKVKSLTDNSERVLDVQGIFVEIGFVVNSALIEGLVELDQYKQVITNNRQETSNPGIFCAGDLTDTPFKQAVVSAGEGCKAALQAYSYINESQERIQVDWNRH